MKMPGIHLFQLKRFEIARTSDLLTSGGLNVQFLHVRAGYDITNGG